MATIRLHGNSYDVEKDFTWGELLDVERLGGQPLARDGSLDHLAVIGAFSFVVLRRSDPQLSWDAFMGGSFDLGDDEEEDEAPDSPAAKKPAAKRPS